MKNNTEQAIQMIQLQKFPLYFCFRIVMATVIFVTAVLFTHDSVRAKQLSVKIGSYENHPKLFVDENDKVSGFWPELIEDIAKKEDWKIEYIRGTWSDGLRRLLQGEIDILPDVAFTEKRNKLYTFSQAPVLMSWSRLYVHADNTTIQSIRDLSNKRIAALKNSVNFEGENGLRDILNRFNIQCTFIPLDTYQEVFQAITDGTVDGGITNRNFGNKHAKEYGLKKTPFMFQPINMQFAFPRESATTPLLAEKINAHMAALIADENSLYYELLKKYFEAGIAEKKVEIIPDWLATLLQFLALLFVVLISIIMATRFQVQRKTRKIREMNRELRVSEEKYRSLVDESPDLRYRLDLEGKVVYASQSMYKLFGYTADEALGMDVTDAYVNPEDRKRFLAKLEKYGYVNNFTTQLKRKDGSIWWAASSAQFYKDHDENILGIDGVTSDITEQKEAEKVVRRSEEQWHRTFNSFPDIVTLQDIDLRIVKANETACSTLDLPIDAIIGHHCYELFHGSGDPCQDCPILETKTSFTPYSREIVHEKLDKTFLVSAAPVMNEEGNLEYIAHVAKDITEVKAAEQDRIRLATAIEQASETIVITDIGGHIQYVNPAFTNLTGYSAEEALGQNPRIVQSGEHDQGFYIEMWATLLRGDTWYGHLTNMKKDGSFFEEEATISPVKDTKGRISNFVAVKRDVSRERLLENQLRQSVKMEAVGTMASGIAHDFNNILAAILGYAEFIQRDVSKESRVGKNIAEILTAGKRAAELVRQILIFSRQQASDKQALLPNLIVNEALNMLRATLPATVTIEDDIDPDCRAILANPTAIHQIVVNLCTNGFQAMAAQKGILQVWLKQQQLTVEDIPAGEKIAAGDFVVLTVTDSGCGMDQATMGRIFEPYFSTKEVGRGTGLGLAVIHGLTKDYGGFVQVKSKVNQGSSFSVYFPVTEEVVIRPVIKKLKKNSEETIPVCARILVVDDELLLVKINEKRLQSMGYDVTSHTDSKKALEAFQNDPEGFDLLVTDQTMPGLTGAELAQAILKLKPSLPIIMCTGHSDIVSEEKAIAMGIKKYVFKPVQGDDLLDAVQEVLADQQVLV